MHKLRLVWFVAFLGGCASEPGDGEPADAKRCSEMRDHLVELRLAEIAGVDLAPHRAALVQALGPDFLSECARTMTIGQAKCTATATTLTDASACSGPAAH